MIVVELSDAECRYIQDIVGKEAKRLEPVITSNCSDKIRNDYHCASGIFNLLTAEWAKKVEQEA